MPGWNAPTTNAKTFSELPKQAQNYVEVRKLHIVYRRTLLTTYQYIEKFVGVKVSPIYEISHDLNAY
jgi:adenylosuccinate synthase